MAILHYFLAFHGTLKFPMLRVDKVLGGGGGGGGGGRCHCNSIRILAIGLKSNGMMHSTMELFKWLHSANFAHSMNLSMIGLDRVWGTTLQLFPLSI